jgi:hypothetical protein
MALDYSRMAIMGTVNPSVKKDIGKWLDQTFKAPSDATSGKLYYEGIMGSTPVQVLSWISQLPEGIPNPQGGTFNTSKFYRIPVVFKKQSLDVVLENIPMQLGQNKAIYNGRTVNAYMGYVVAAIMPAKLNAKNGGEMAEMLWDN